MIKITKKGIFALFAIPAVILCSGHALQTLYSQLGYSVIPFAAIVLIMELYRRRGLSLDRMQLAVLLFGCMILCTVTIYLGAGIRFYIIQMCYILMAYGIARIYGFRQMAGCYLKIMTVTTVIAIVGYYLVQNTTLLEVLPLMNNVNHVEYRVGIIFNYIPIASERNCGMFWEPGLLATHLILSIVLEIMLREKPSFLRLLIFSVGIYTANSSAGFALWMLCVILFFIKKVNLSGNVFSTITGVIVLGIGIAVILNFDKILAQTSLGDNEYLQKLSSDSIADSSRLRALEHNMKSFLSAPIFGVGISGARQNFQHVADTSTSTYFMSVFGIPGMLYTVYWVYGITKIPKVNALAKILLLVIILVILNKEPHHQNLMTWCILFALLRGDYSEPDNDKLETHRIVKRVRWSNSGQ